MTDRLLFEALVIVSVAFIGIAFLVPIRVSSIVAYLAAGLVIGPYGFDVLPETDGIHFLGELGVAFLMFIVGLEFSLSRMIAARRVVFGLGGVQVVATVLLCVAAVWAVWETDLLVALLVGGAVAMSSTAITAKHLSDQGELSSQHGRLALGMLLFQDLATLPFLILIDAVAGHGDESIAATALRAAFTVAAFLVVAFAGRRTLPAFMAWIARGGSSEFFQLSSIMLVLGAAFLAQQAGLSIPIGAFLAGMVLGESDYRHQIEEEIRPFRDVLLGLFFVTTGMTLDPFVVIMHPVAVTLTVFMLIVVKTFVVVVSAKALGWAITPSLRAGLVVAHAGEFALLLLTQAFDNGLLPTELAQMFLVGSGISMAIASVWIPHNGWLAERIAMAHFQREGPQVDESSTEAIVGAASRALSGHIILCGCGRVGQLVATVLDLAAVPYVALERDPRHLQDAKRKGHHVLFGDATRRGILRAAGLPRASAVVSTLPRGEDAERLGRQIRSFDAAATVPLIVGVKDEREVQSLLDAGATPRVSRELGGGAGAGGRDVDCHRQKSGGSG
ncbi:cation:proton antiporter [Consotaella salsifontis]|uniref:Kef-type potassium/proton antiporter, CPA2 family n=1 Tax=Consotaella salsifontis TaxID=1365950 RepID=A0A1T4S9R8_9HYPH|nr:cation:proton antiporter [Consotaella salsifontis]SKA24927.1 Kef-type potassium/proton antiporter, CPA2 family [Consotaella salsifontis]